MNTRIGLASLALLAMVATACPPDRPVGAPVADRPQNRPCNPHSVVVVRHAEKAAVDPAERDPDLSPKGLERATRLAKLLGDASITRLIASEFKRTQQTLAPLSARVGKPVDVLPAARGTDLARELRDAAPGSLTVVATHSNVIPRIVRDLGGGALRGVGADGALADDDYGRVLVVSLGCSATASVVELSSD